jgi:hypothetical protein
MTSTLTLGTRVDPIIFRRLLAACRRNAILIRHTSPWQPPAEDVRLQQIEPWSLRVHDGAVYLRAWSTSLQDVRNYRVADIEAALDLEGPPCAPRHPPPADPWADESPAFGIDYDRPNTAVIRLRGGVARWVARVIWHPGEQDVWLDNGELLERTVAYRSCREMARRLASLLDGIVGSAVGSWVGFAVGSAVGSWVGFVVGSEPVSAPLSSSSSSSSSAHAPRPSPNVIVRVKIQGESFIVGRLRPRRGALLSTPSIERGF